VLLCSLLDHAQRGRQHLVQVVERFGHHDFEQYPLARLDFCLACEAGGRRPSLVIASLQVEGEYT
jgi:hypothetical protein